MSERFLKSLGRAEEQYRAILPTLLRRAAKQNRGTIYYLKLMKLYQAWGTTISCRLEDGYISRSCRKITYENFVKNLSPQDLRAIAEKLKELGF